MKMKANFMSFYYTNTQTHTEAAATATTTKRQKSERYDLVIHAIDFRKRKLSLSMSSYLTFHLFSYPMFITFLSFAYACEQSFNLFIRFCVGVITPMHTTKIIPFSK